ncbi:MAG: 1-deoxy-D-xylulose-5-phosphate synthase [Candidatus Margulisbacteria bacterium]|nr:1-deoxy-D-xylulose-5-phosphate synthase [Candidatus Margulisiibacteriota bacterium]MBU1021124.1 1-deoxy-D-xylulose-5-phosphate synthase [Candidatus Margulisiibacteriota bacterium]MBU1728679.1 1-deoxy-D-xylulose-5-phosphate synthase [Candidatus Margulisiibacteriota bacterium]MBU1955130.1 1-deoxy-D-xylulose-5-phosphate synthase [Candidatus Margulisiibacteriota bacterium]
MGRIIDEIKLPQGLNYLSTEQLEQVAKEVRGVIIKATSKVGGHLSSSLGAVELSIALHSIYDSPRDKIVWDVGHQAYAHKILTGRLERFDTIRQYGGLSGFPNITESPHDHFTVGHASTSISSALGLAQARDLKGEKHAVVAVIGDASLSGGLALEAVNNLVHLKSNLIIVLNDNEMFISKGVGALSNYLTRVRTNPLYFNVKERIEKLISKIPRIGVPLVRSAEKLKDRTKHFFVDFKVGVIFEELGFKYFGPIDGHNIPLLMSTLHHAKEVNGPVLIHILTKKGKGYAPAEKNPTLFHSAPPFDLKTGKPIPKNGRPSYTSVFGKAMVKIAKQNDKVAAITAAMVDGTGLVDFAKEFPKRFFDVGIAEGHAVTFAGGLCKGGFKPVVAIYSTFLQRSYDHIIHDVALQNLPVVFAIDRAGIVGEDGATHNGCFDITYMRSIPNMVVMAPKDENELQNMLFTAANYQDGPISIRYPRGRGFGVALDEKLKNIPVGQAEVVFNPPSGAADVSIIAIGSMVYPSIEAAKSLKKEGIAASVINARYVKPLDEALILKEVGNKKLIVTVEEGTLEGGFGSAVAELLLNHKIVTPVKRLGIPDKFVQHGDRNIILELCGLTPEKIVENVKKGL